MVVGGGGKTTGIKMISNHCKVRKGEAISQFKQTNDCESKTEHNTHSMLLPNENVNVSVANVDDGTKRLENDDFDDLIALKGGSA